MRSTISPEIQAKYDQINHYTACGCSHPDCWIGIRTWAQEQERRNVLAAEKIREAVRFTPDYEVEVFDPDVLRSLRESYGAS